MTTILITAYDVNPYKGSESGTGWNFVLQAARFNKVIAITRKNNRENIDKYISQFKVDSTNIRFCYFDLPYYLRFWKKGARGSSLYFYLWQMFIPLFISKNSLKFDIAHNVNFHADSFPTFLWVLGKPVVWGPINHNEKIPGEYLRSKKEYLRDRLKWLLRILVWSCDPFMQLARKKSDVIIGGNTSVKKRLSIEDDKFVQMTQVASQASDKNTVLGMNCQFNVLVVGRFLTIKSIDLAIYAFDDFFNKLKSDQQKDVQLTIVGQGPKEKVLKGIANQLGSKNAIKFVGWVDRAKMDQYYQDSKIFMFPSHEGAGMVVAEALSKSLPIVCFNNYGPGEFVNSDCAIRIPYTNYQQSILDFSDAIMQLYCNEEKLSEMSKSAVELFEKKYTWDHKGMVLRDIYKKLIKG